jgi:thiol:disulfide interchange protein/DsbC/DsbD-like thiol-disulfide interchange protein
MIRTLRATLAILCLFAVFPAIAQGQQEQQTQKPEAEHLAKIRLVPERGAVKPGEEIWVGIEQSIKPEWHTYWKNPGDSGTAPRITWTLPAGFEAGPVEWPVPHKIAIGPLVNYGYEGSAILLQKLKIPPTLPPGPITLTADVEVLVCQEQCIPEYGTYELILNGPEAETENNADYFTQARALLPKPAPWKTAYKEENGFFVISLPSEAAALQDIEFIPEDWGLVSNGAKPEIKDGTLRQQRGDRPLANLSEIGGLLTYLANGESHALSFTAHKDRMSLLAVNANRAMEKIALLNILLFALLGGLILNLMPCVFPVLSIKALNLVKISERHPELARLHGLYYTAGVVSSFLFIAALLMILRAGGAEIGWGFQLQNPVVVTLLAWLLFVIGLNFSGLFEISGALGNFGNKLTQGNNLKNTFFTGVLATLVATPCTAPFMAAAIGAALTQPPILSLVIFAALGLGLALPYLVLSFMPALQKLLPRPGQWMVAFRQILAFPMYASSVWLIWVLSQQAGPMGTLGSLIGIVLIGLGIQLLRYKRSLPALVTFAAALLLLPAGQITPLSTNPLEIENGFGEVYTPEKLETLLGGNDPVFVEMTAAWCITCKVNHAVAIDTKSTRKVFESNHVQYLVGDWTSQDSAITEYLNSFGRNGVPIYVFYGRRDITGQRPGPVLLPQLLTPGIVADAVNGK